VFFVKKVDLPPTQGALCTISVFFLHFTYLGGAYAPNAPPCLRARLSLLKYNQRALGRAHTSTIVSLTIILPQFDTVSAVIQFTNDGKKQYPESKVK